MANTVVIFGMAHSGKSTCGGYIYNQSMQDKSNYDFERYIDSVREELGDKYDMSRDYGYLLDKSKDFAFGIIIRRPHNQLTFSVYHQRQSALIRTNNVPRV